MPVAGDRPESGVRIALERPRDPECAPWTYAGAAHTPQATFPLRVVVKGDGEVVVTLDAADGGEPPPPDLAEKVRLIVRTVQRQAASDGEPPPLRIARWRGEK